MIESSPGWGRRLLQFREQGLARVRQGRNNEIRVIQRRAYGPRDEEYRRGIRMIFMNTAQLQ